MQRTEYNDKWLKFHNDKGPTSPEVDEIKVFDPYYTAWQASCRTDPETSKHWFIDETVGRWLHCDLAIIMHRLREVEASLGLDRNRKTIEADLNAKTLTIELGTAEGEVVTSALMVSDSTTAVDSASLTQGIVATLAEDSAEVAEAVTDAVDAANDAAAAAGAAAAAAEAAANNPTEENLAAEAAAKEALTEARAALSSAISNIEAKADSLEETQSEAEEAAEASELVARKTARAEDASKAVGEVTALCTTGSRAAALVVALAIDVATSAAAMLEALVDNGNDQEFSRQKSIMNNSATEVDKNNRIVLDSSARMGAPVAATVTAKSEAEEDEEEAKSEVDRVKPLALEAIAEAKKVEMETWAALTEEQREEIKNFTVTCWDPAYRDATVVEQILEVEEGSEALYTEENLVQSCYQFSTVPHLSIRVCYYGEQKLFTLWEWIEILRNYAGVAPFGWKYCPPPDRAFPPSHQSGDGIDVRQVVEYLQAIGRVVPTPMCGTREHDRKLYLHEGWGHKEQQVYRTINGERDEYDHMVNTLESTVEDTRKIVYLCNEDYINPDQADEPEDTANCGPNTQLVRDEDGNIVYDEFGNEETEIVETCVGDACDEQVAVGFWKYASRVAIGEYRFLDQPGGANNSDEFCACRTGPTGIAGLGAGSQGAYNTPWAGAMVNSLPLDHKTQELEFQSFATEPWTSVFGWFDTDMLRRWEGCAEVIFDVANGASWCSECFFGWQGHGWDENVGFSYNYGSDGKGPTSTFLFQYYRYYEGRHAWEDTCGWDCTFNPWCGAYSPSGFGCCFTYRRILVDIVDNICIYSDPIIIDPPSTSVDSSSPAAGHWLWYEDMGDSGSRDAKWVSGFLSVLEPHTYTWGGIMRYCFSSPSPTYSESIGPILHATHSVSVENRPSDGRLREFAANYSTATGYDGEGPKLLMGHSFGPTHLTGQNSFCLNVSDGMHAIAGFDEQQKDWMLSPLEKQCSDKITIVDVSIYTKPVVFSAPFELVHLVDDDVEVGLWMNSYSVGLERTNMAASILGYVYVPTSAGWSGSNRLDCTWDERDLFPASVGSRPGLPVDSEVPRERYWRIFPIGNNGISKWGGAFCNEDWYGWGHWRSDMDHEGVGTSSDSFYVRYGQSAPKHVDFRAANYNCEGDEPHAPSCPEIYFYNAAPKWDNVEAKYPQQLTEAEWFLNGDGPDQRKYLMHFADPEEMMELRPSELAVCKEDVAAVYATIAGATHEHMQEVSIGDAGAGIVTSVAETNCGEWLTTGVNISVKSWLWVSRATPLTVYASPSNPQHWASKEDIGSFYQRNGSQIIANYYDEYCSDCWVEDVGQGTGDFYMRMCNPTIGEICSGCEEGTDKRAECTKALVWRHLTDPTQVLGVPWVSGGILDVDNYLGQAMHSADAPLDPPQDAYSDGEAIAMYDPAFLAIPRAYRLKKERSPAVLKSRYAEQHPLYKTIHPKEWKYYCGEQPSNWVTWNESHVSEDYTSSFEAGYQPTDWVQLLCPSIRVDDKKETPLEPKQIIPPWPFLSLPPKVAPSKVTTVIEGECTPIQSEGEPVELLKAMEKSAPDYNYLEPNKWSDGVTVARTAEIAELVAGNADAAVVATKDLAIHVRLIISDAEAANENLDEALYDQTPSEVESEVEAIIEAIAEAVVVGRECSTKVDLGASAIEEAIAQAIIVSEATTEEVLQEASDKVKEQTRLAITEAAEADTKAQRVKALSLPPRRAYLDIGDLVSELRTEWGQEGLSEEEILERTTPLLKLKDKAEEATLAIEEIASQTKAAVDQLYAALSLATGTKQTREDALLAQLDSEDGFFLGRIHACENKHYLPSFEYGLQCRMDNRTTSTLIGYSRIWGCFCTGGLLTETVKCEDYVTNVEDLACENAHVIRDCWVHGPASSLDVSLATTVSGRRAISNCYSTTDTPLVASMPQLRFPLIIQSHWLTNGVERPSAGGVMHEALIDFKHPETYRGWYTNASGSGWTLNTTAEPASRPLPLYYSSRYDRSGHYTLQKTRMEEKCECSSDRPAVPINTIAEWNYIMAGIDTAEEYFAEMEECAANSECDHMEIYNQYVCTYEDPMTGTSRSVFCPPRQGELLGAEGITAHGVQKIAKLGGDIFVGNVAVEPCPDFRGWLVANPNILMSNPNMTGGSSYLFDKITAHYYGDITPHFGKIGGICRGKVFTPEIHGLRIKQQGSNQTGIVDQLIGGRLYCCQSHAQMVGSVRDFVKEVKPPKQKKTR